MQRHRLIGFIVVMAVVNIAYRLVYATGSQRTAALFIGVPTILAVGLALLPRSASAIGTLLKGSTLALLIATIVLPEGLLCLLFVVPIVAFISVIVGGAIDINRHYRKRQGPTLMVISLPLVLLSLEGVVGSPFDDRASVTASVIVVASPAEVEAALAATPAFDAPVPTFLRMGFNRPVAARGGGLEPGATRVIEFTGGTHDDHPLRLFGLTGERSVHHHAQMDLVVADTAPGRVEFHVTKDTTMLARWAEVDRSVVSWQATDDGRTRVTWRLDYRRLLYPTAYFAPLYRFGMRQAAGYLLDAVVTRPVT